MLNQKKIAKLLILFLILPLTLTRILGGFQDLEQYNYDLFFRFKGKDSIDNRIALVVWEEADLQHFGESTLNDYILNSVLNKIQKQEPRLIGLDLYRDIAVPSNKLNDQADRQAYDNLQDTFKKTLNLYGIEKVIRPKIRPNSTLKEEKRTFSSDLITDNDNIIRRSFINSSDNSTYIGTALGYLYLKKENWNHALKGRSSLSISKDDKEIVLQAIDSFRDKVFGRKFPQNYFINWRKADFNQYAVRDILDNKVSADAFTDKIVLIGNISSSSGDIHYIPTDKWDQVQPWTYGINVVAHVSSSIISAALDDRTLIKNSPWIIEFGLIFGLPFLMLSSLEKISILPVNKRYLFTIFICILLTLALFLASFFSFYIFGHWLSTIAPLFSIWLSFFLINYEIQIRKEKQNITKLEIFIGYLCHEIKNLAYTIELTNSEIESQAQGIEGLVNNDFNEETELALNLEDLGLDLKEKAQEIIFQASQVNLNSTKIARCSKRTQEYLRYSSYLEEKHLELTSINDFVSSLLDNLETNDREYNASRHIITDFDILLKRETIDRVIFEIIFSNLVENACDSLYSKWRKDKSFIPKLTIGTKKLAKTFEISICDNGEGVSENKKEQIFNLGFSTKTESQGTGLGLFLVKEFLELEKGTILFSSTEGEGAKFTISFHRSRK